MTYEEAVHVLECYITTTDLNRRWQNMHDVTKERQLLEKELEAVLADQWSVSLDPRANLMPAFISSDLSNGLITPEWVSRHRRYTSGLPLKGHRLTPRGGA